MKCYCCGDNFLRRSDITTVLFSRGSEDGLLIRRAYSETPPRVEYEITDRGRRLVILIDQIRAFARDWAEHLEETAIFTEK
ncbi:MAG: hypothetical protein CFK49_06070 [Armatimonadetes bacterium JP3_11]|nr:MAG: hypothetical protein CFK49_06070 [Armatimonadetes bacterium JP3_11]RMH09245.1 MAG: transcriptional regulator [Armatimonadota bacterium]